MIGEDGGTETLRRQGRRFAWLMAGAAIALAVVLLVVVVAQVAGMPGPAWVLVGSALALAAVLGLVPGVRELEVTGARSMLGTDGELLVPQRPRRAHHLQTALWVLLHLAGGLLVAVLLATFVPSAVLVIVENVAGRSWGSGVPVGGSVPGRAENVVLALLVGLASLLLWWPLGAALAGLAPRFLRPTTADRLALAQARADREAERTRIARELHDGIGHALTILSVQAAAARRIQHRDPGAAAEALARIEDTARGATGELDAMLALLREEERGTAGPAARERTDRRSAADRREEGPSGPPPSDLEQILMAHRRAGMELSARVKLPEDLAELQHRHLVRIVAELLTNAQRHGAAGPVRLSLSSGEDRIRLEVTSALTEHPPADERPAEDRPDLDLPAEAGTRTVGGRGLQGLRERAELLGGSMEAGPRGGDWVAHIELPLLREGPPR